MKFLLATRKSPLALWQAQAVRTRLANAWDDLELALVEIASSGDRVQDVELARFGRIGIFTVEVDRAVQDGRARASVHSLKDMTTELQEGLVLAATLERAPARDALVSREGRRLDELPPGARVATGSQRRSAMLKAVRPDLEVVGIRGNVATRLAKLDAGEADALMLAHAGIARLGLQHRVTQVLDEEAFLPAVGQAIVGVVCRADDAEARRRLAPIRDPDSWDEARAERAFLAALRGGCNVPVGGHARADGDELWLRGRVLSLDGARVVEGDLRGPRSDPESIGRSLAAALLDDGAGELVEAARS